MATVVAGEYTLEKQKRRVGEIAKRAGDTLTAKDILFHEKSLLHHNHIFGGTTGDWQAELPARAVEILERRYGAWLRENGYTEGRPVVLPGEPGGPLGP